MKKIGLLVIALFMAGVLAACAQPAGASKIILAADMVRGAEGAPKGAVCVLNNQYHRGEAVVFRVRLTDGETGDEIPANAADLLARETPPDREEIGEMTGGIEAIVHLSDGQSFSLHYGAHSPDRPADYFWTTNWVVPDDYPTGTIGYYVTADWEAESKSGRFDPFNVFPNLLTIIE
ncbi:MAG: hypothetical protein V3R96_06895 [Dehalococcoidales bacterium]